MKQGAFRNFLLVRLTSLFWAGKGKSGAFGVNRDDYFRASAQR